MPSISFTLPRGIQRRGFPDAVFRDTTDVATSHLAGLKNLKRYYAGATQITDASLEMLCRIKSLEEIELWECQKVTDEGISHLATLPKLRKLEVSGLSNVTLAGTTVLPARVQVTYSVGG